MWEFPIARAYADARVHRIFGGSNEIMRELIARAVAQSAVMPGLDPGIHDEVQHTLNVSMDCRAGKLVQPA